MKPSDVFSRLLRQIQPLSLKMKYVRPKSGLKRAYANHVGIAQTEYDVRLTFGEIIDATMEEMTIEERVQVTLSWLEAKRTLEFL